MIFFIDHCKYKNHLRRAMSFPSNEETASKNCALFIVVDSSFYFSFSFCEILYIKINLPAGLFRRLPSSSTSNGDFDRAHVANPMMKSIRSIVISLVKLAIFSITYLICT